MLVRLSRLRSARRGTKLKIITGIIILLIAITLLSYRSQNPGHGSLAAVIIVDSSQSIPGLTVFFYGNESTGNIESYEWDFGDGNLSQEMNPAHNYGEVGYFDVKLMVKDDHGETARTNLTLSVQHGDAWIDETLDRRVCIRSGSGNIFDAPIGPNIGNPTANVQLTITQLVGVASIEICAEIDPDPDHINEPASRIALYQEQFTSTGQTIERSYDVSASMIPSEAASIYSILTVTIMLYKGYWTGVSLIALVDFPLNDDF